MDSPNGKALDASVRRPGIRQPGIRQLTVFVAVVGLLTRALIPVGYMPGNLLAGEFMVLCPTGLPALLSDAHAHHGDAGTMVDADRACPIGVAIQYSAALPTGPDPSPVVRGAAERPLERYTSLESSNPPSLFQARAPPAARI